MTKTKTRSFWKVASLVLLTALILSPVAIVSAAEGEDGEYEKKKRLHPRLGEVVEIDTEANTILVEARHPKWSEEEEIDHTVLIHYTDDTMIREDREEVDESAIEAGEKIVVRGERIDSEEYFAEIEAEKIHVFDDLKPKRLGKHKLKKQEKE